MSKKKILIIVNCVLFLILAVLVAVTLGSQSSDPILDILPTESVSSTENTTPSSIDTTVSNEGTTAPTEQMETTNETKPTQGTDPTENTKPTEGTEPTEDTKPTQGTDSTEDTKPTQGTDPTEGTKPTEGTDPTEDTKPTEGTDPTEDTKPTEGTESTETTNPPTEPEEEQPTLPEELPPEVVIPPEVDPDTGETHFAFPCQVPGYDLVVEKLAPYDGMFVEDGTNVQSEGVAMLLIRNEGEFSVEYTQICVEYPQETLLFDISALPDGEKLVVQEKTGKKLPEGEPVSVTAMVVRRAEMEMSEDQIQVIDNGDNTLTIRNVSNKAIPTIRIFYKYYMENEQIFVGGIAFTLRVTQLGPGDQVTVQPAHYASQTSRVVMVLTYDFEV